MSQSRPTGFDTLDQVEAALGSEHEYRTGAVIIYRDVMFSRIMWCGPADVEWHQR